jgi:hypothetical protein
MATDLGGIWERHLGGWGGHGEASGRHLGGWGGHGRPRGAILQILIHLSCQMQIVRLFLNFARCFCAQAADFVTPTLKNTSRNSKINARSAFGMRGVSIFGVWRPWASHGHPSLPDASQMPPHGHPSLPDASPRCLPDPSPFWLKPFWLKPGERTSWTRPVSPPGRHE